MSELNTLSWQVLIQAVMCGTRGEIRTMTADVVERIVDIDQNRATIVVKTENSGTIRCRADLSPVILEEVEVPNERLSDLQRTPTSRLPVYLPHTFLVIGEDGQKWQLKLHYPCLSELLQPH